MNNQNPNVGLMYFSPTGTTKRVCEEIAQSISTTSPVRIDLTKFKTLELTGADKVDLWIVGVPVYASRMPSLARERISTVLYSLPKKTSAVAIVVYGNVDLGIALKQLIDLLSVNGLNVIGAGEFIGQHYFKQFHGIEAEGTIARPNDTDLAVARELGVALIKKGLDSPCISSMNEVQSARVSLKFKFTSEERVLGLLGSSSVDLSKCIKCQACVKACPVSCIDAKTLMSDASTKICLGCGNCMRVCPKKARSQSIKMKWMVKRMAKPNNPPKKSTYYA
jgi:Pyruvate/2-oxoacid:ferredoxin oxidoreductase delta subunit